MTVFDDKAAELVAKLAVAKSAVVGATTLPPTTPSELEAVTRAVIAPQVAAAKTAQFAAEAARATAEGARDAALIQPGLYATEALGRAAVADGQAFKVQGSGDAAALEYRRTNSTTSVLLASYPSAAYVARIDATSELQLEVVPNTSRSTATGRLKGLVPKTDSSIDLHFTAGDIGLRGKNPANTKRTYTFAADTVINLPGTMVLIWDFTDNVVKTQYNYDPRPAAGHALLAYNNQGQIVSGLLLDAIQQIQADTSDMYVVTAPPGLSEIVQQKTAGGTATIALAATAIYAVCRSGQELAQKLAGSLAAPFVLAANQVLIWDLVTNTVSAMGNNDRKPMPHVMLANCRTGGIVDTGALFEKHVSNRLLLPALNSTLVEISHVTYSANGKDPTPKVSGSTITIDDLRLYAMGWDGTTVKQSWWGVGAGFTGSYTFADDEILIWNWDTNALVKMANGAARPAKFVVLLQYKFNKFITGDMLPMLVQAYASEFSLMDSVADASEGRAFIVSNKRAEQGITAIREQIWSFSGSLANHSNFVPVSVYDKDDFALLGTLTHNFGHAATADYQVDTDTLGLGNGESDVNVLPRIDLIPNISSYLLGDVLDFNNASSTPRVSIEFFVKDGAGAVTKQIGGSGCVMCFGEAPHIAYMITGQGSVRHKVMKVLLGMGANDFSDATGADLTKWGTFTAGKADTEYNGTAKILATYTGLEYNVSQGLTFHEGKLYYGITSTPNTVEAIEVQLLENGKFRTTKTFKYMPVLPSGASPAIESEGTCIVNGRYLLVGGLYGAAYGWAQFWALFPLYNEMGGKGSVGVKVSYPFKVNGVPQVQITATSATTDLYISANDRTGFTVSSKSGATGTFVWAARIS